MRLLFLFLLASFLWAKIVWPPPPEKPRIEYVRAIERPQDLGIDKSLWEKLKTFLFGEKEESRIIKPSGVYVTERYMVVADQGIKGVFLFDLKKKRFKVVYGFPSPIDVDLLPDGTVLVTDSQLGRVFLLSLEGKRLGSWGENLLERPTGLAVDRKRKRVYVVDTLKSRVLVFDFKGRKIGEFGKELARPTYIALDGEGNVYVSDSLNAKVRIYSPDGKLMRSFGERGNTIGTFANPRGIAVDSHGHIYVGDTLFSVIQIFDQEGKLLLVVGRFGKGEGEFAFPMDLYIRGNRIYVADSYNARIVVLRYLGGE
ncbi:MAG: 6-bladed beta-propeller [Aquificae bacterium]|nr:6-bladed beta-propeller [Aquificota bacterium]